MRGSQAQRLPGAFGRQRMAPRRQVQTVCIPQPIVVHHSCIPVPHHVAAVPLSHVLSDGIQVHDALLDAPQHSRSARRVPVGEEQDMRAAVSQSPHPGFKVCCEGRHLKITPQTVIDSSCHAHEIWLQNFCNRDLLRHHICHEPASDCHVGV